MNQVNVVAFFATENIDEADKSPVPANYPPEPIRSIIPQSFIDDMRDVAWLNDENMICFPHDYVPEPVKADDGDVYLFVSDAVVNEQSALFDKARAEAIESEISYETAKECVSATLLDLLDKATTLLNEPTIH
jgi:hypothetical protein